MFSYKRWKKKCVNINEGEIVMLCFPGQFKDEFVIARVDETHKSNDGLIRQVTVSFRRKNSKEWPN